MKESYKKVEKKLIRNRWRNVYKKPKSNIKYIEHKGYMIPLSVYKAGKPSQMINPISIIIGKIKHILEIFYKKLIKNQKEYLQNVLANLESNYGNIITSYSFIYTNYKKVIILNFNDNEIPTIVDNIFDSFLRSSSNVGRTEISNLHTNIYSLFGGFFLFLLIVDKRTKTLSIIQLRFYPLRIYNEPIDYVKDDLRTHIYNVIQHAFRNYLVLLDDAEKLQKEQKRRRSSSSSKSNNGIKTQKT
jgi:hypothetical protein